jgi:sirohydrochlorin ferrochelatase
MTDGAQLRAAREGSPAPLVLAAHGSTDHRFAEVMADLAELVRFARPGLDVRIGYLEHGPPALRDVAGEGDVVVPVLLTNGYHVHIDIPSRAAGATVASAVGPDRRIATVLATRLRERGWRGDGPVILAAAGSADDQALADARLAAADLAAELQAPVTAAFIGSGEPRLRDLQPGAVATYLLAPGRFSTIVVACGAPVVAAPLGADPLLAEVILDRYELASVDVPPPQPAPHVRHRYATTPPR